MKRTSLTGLAVILVLLVAGVYFFQGSRAPKGQPELVAMDNRAFSALQSEFNRTRGDVRAILLLSPT